MSDAWEILRENSIAPDGSDAWVHLNSQNCTGGEVRYISDKSLSFTMKIKKTAFQSRANRIQFDLHDMCNRNS